MLNPFRPKPAPAGFGHGKTVPEQDASVLSRLIFGWLSPFLAVGFTRPLEKEDLWQLPPQKLTDKLTDDLQRNFFARCPPEQRPAFLRDAVVSDEKIAETMDADTLAKEGSSHAPHTKPSWFSRGTKPSEPAKDPQYDSSLVKALHATFFWKFWISGILKLGSDMLNTTTPLVNKVLLTWLTTAYVHHRIPTFTEPQGIGYGIGLAFALFAMQEVSSLLNNHYMYISMTMGMTIRSAIIGNIFRKALRLSARARNEHSVGQITTMISTDSTRLDLASGFVHNLWVAPIQLIIGIALLINNLGYSALVGLGVLIIGFPVQFIPVKIMFAQRTKGIKITDKRVRLTTEILQGIRLIKFYAWEEFYAHQVHRFREGETAANRAVAISLSSLISLVTALPILATILSFITYALTGHALTPAIIFSSLQLFNIIRAPLIFIPVVLSVVADALVALGRLSKVLVAEELAEPYLIDPSSKYAVNADGDFTWETTEGINASKADSTTLARNDEDVSKKKDKSKKKQKNILPTDSSDVTATPQSTDTTTEPPFALKGLQLKIAKGAFVAFVGKVGSGKSSVLQALIGEMRRTRGDVVFGGTVSYVPQTAWIMNTTLRQNILFGQEEDEGRYQDIVAACSLQQDIDMLPNRDQTEIGEKGINLSGGQKARVSLARAAYSNADIVLLDDPLSAVDAHVGKAILEDCLVSGPLASKTRILVTHALHVLPKVDYIYVVDNGVIAEHGTYQDLMRDDQAFSRLVNEWGGTLAHGHPAGPSSKPSSTKHAAATSEKEDESAALMSEEERYTGAVSFSVYKKYLQHAGGLIWAPVIVILLMLAQAAQVANSLFLGFWTGGTIHGFGNAQYMGVYAALGVCQSIFAFAVCLAFNWAGLYASLSLFRAALNGVLRSPVSFFDTTPMGRVLSRLSKDQDTLDTHLSMTMYAFTATFSVVIGTIFLVFYTFPLLGIIFAPLGVLYYVVAIFYRRSSVETKRLDSIMRSALYASFSETLTGLSTVRACREQPRFIRNANEGLDMENRAYFMTIAIQRWLSVRLDFFGNVLVLGLTLFAAGFRNTVSPSQVGVVLSYTLGITASLSEMVSQFAQNEQNMNAVERVLVYTELPREGAITTPNDPPESWPEHGQVKFTDVELAYREGLPLVLKGVSFEINRGEKVGIVGRTGAGKTSVLQALFRMVEVARGKIEIDGHDIRHIGLDDLRKRLALVPQDSTMFLGTLRENLDPQNNCTDAEVIAALRRTGLLPRDDEPADTAAEAKFSLDTTVGDEGSNFSVGEKQLLALCRALLKSSRVIVLDEATSSVDYETDAKIQRAIQTEFATCTLLCIAHRLNTIVYYDRVLVMDAGVVAEFDTPLNLFDREDSIFRALCNEARLSRADIVHIRREMEKLGTAVPPE